MSNKPSLMKSLHPGDALQEGNFLLDADDLLTIAEEAKKHKLSLIIVGRIETDRFKNPVEVVLMNFEKTGDHFKQQFLFEEVTRGALTQEILAVVERRT